ncbi:16495_t:CDS:2 [Acaulospora morrowiae]|uniref:16495_t:CDS:1 n=1 Tax=Acaulospora morrowiae TaxID=94023 RepID=A0A9N9HI24_9GLOM|nr:16495_t:CDS:2 [Acaulospora morrowiae]
MNGSGADGKKCFMNKVNNAVRKRRVDGFVPEFLSQIICYFFITFAAILSFAAIQVIPPADSLEKGEGGTNGS